jgi:hypothetical protein
MSRPIVYFAALAAVFATAHLASAETVVAAGASDQTSARHGAGRMLPPGRPPSFARRQPLDPEPLDANLLIGSMEDLLRRALGPSIDCRLDLSEDLWTVLCDRNQLESAILNLAINAHDAVPDGVASSCVPKIFTGTGVSRPRRLTASPRTRSRSA